MPITTKSKKALRQNLKKAKRNRLVLANVKTLQKKTRKAIDAKADNTQDLIKQTVKTIDKQIQKGRIKKNTGARMKSRMMKSHNKTKTTATAK